MPRWLPVVLIALVFPAIASAGESEIGRENIGMRLLS